MYGCAKNSSFFFFRKILEKKNVSGLPRRFGFFVQIRPIYLNERRLISSLRDNQLRKTYLSNFVKARNKDVTLERMVQITVMQDLHDVLGKEKDVSL